MILLRAVIFGIGLFVVIRTVFSSIRTFVLPRAAPDKVTGLVFSSIRFWFELRVKWTRSYEVRDQVMALYAPVAVLSLLPGWLTFVLLGYMLMYWATGTPTWGEAFILSGSSLFTLGFARSDLPAHILLTFSEATIGLILVALLMAYLPTMYGAFSNRERAVTMLEVRAGSPPSAVEMLLRFQRLGSWDRLLTVWDEWEAWFAALQESHTSLAALVFFRSPQPEHSWVTASGAVLDAAALYVAAVDVPWDAQAALCLRAGYLALQTIADFFQITYNPQPQFPADSISITREEFDQACEQLAKGGVPLKADLDQGWQDFAGWRVNYDRVLVELARLTMAPPAPWSSDRF